MEIIHHDVFADNLIGAMRQTGYTPTELADVVGVSRISIYKYIGGEVIPSLTRAMAICHALRIGVDDLVKGVYEVK